MPARLNVRVVSATGLAQATYPCIGVRLWKDVVPSEDEWVFTTARPGGNPTFDEKFCFDVSPTGDQSLEVAAYDQPVPGGKRVFLGQNLVYLAEIEPHCPLPFDMLLLGPTTEGGVEARVKLELLREGAAAPA
eukprot:RCo050449